MKLALLMAAAGIGTVAFAPSAAAQVYGGVGYTFISTDADGEDLSFGALTGRLGYKFNPMFAIEGEAAIGVQDETIDVLGTDVDFGLENEVGVFAVGYVPLPGFGDLFGRVGYANVSIEAEGGGASASEDDSGIAYGAGLQFGVSGINLRAEYTRYEPGDGEFDTYGLSAVLQF